MVMLSTPPPMAASAPSVHDLVRGHGDRLQAGRAKSIHGGRGHRDRQARRRWRLCAPRSSPACRVGWPQPRITSSDFGGIELRRFSASRPRMQCAARSSGRVMLNEPRNDFASGVRELATMTASLTLPLDPVALSNREFSLFRQAASAAGRASKACHAAVRIRRCARRRFSDPTVSAYHMGPPR